MWRVANGLDNAALDSKWQSTWHQLRSNEGLQQVRVSACLNYYNYEKQNNGECLT